MSIYWKLLGRIDRCISNLKYRYIKNRNLKFLKEYFLEERTEKQVCTKYNPYEGSSIILIDKLVDSGAMQQNQYIMDVGAGVGLFLIYLHTKGFKRLYGMEVDKQLFSIAKDNVQKYSQKVSGAESDITLRCGDILEANIPDEIDVFYFFNPFYDTEAYEICFQRIKESINRNKRAVRLIFLYPTVPMRIATKNCCWLVKKGRILDEDYPYSKYMNFLVYENTLDEDCEVV